jgi:site-specific recombinase XerD
MHDLISLDGAPLAIPPLPFERERESARRYAGKAKADSTIRGYKADFEAFTTWCRARGLAWMPATSETVILHISWLADDGKSVSTIGRRLAGIAYVHKLGRYPNPCRNDDLAEVLGGIRRTIGTAPKRKAAATADRVRAMLDACPGTMIGIRDRALLALGFAGAFRRSELVALLVSDLTEVPDGYRVSIRRSKTDQCGEGQEIVIPRGHKIRPVAAVQAWLEASQITDGYLLRSVWKGGRVMPRGLGGHDVSRRVKHYARAAGFTAEEIASLSGHSLRAGFATSAAETGASILKIMETTRHKSVDVLAAYVRRVDLFKDHAGAAFL